ncbi:glucosaminidase domain-containing protein [uncultured Enterococcus sp.]|uniref:glucosaminidase domain-containing protein n=1 Tax=uncultured Enterococcus sp. TaxID=167972 RepID=UPI002AA70667|nr:glucosaminidase domain-containing protein [uncultured Enterococcus sp.]
MKRKVMAICTLSLLLVQTFTPMIVYGAENAEAEVTVPETGTSETTEETTDSSTTESTDSSDIGESSTGDSGSGTTDSSTSPEIPEVPAPPVETPQVPQTPPTPAPSTPPTQTWTDTGGTGTGQSVAPEAGTISVNRNEPTDLFILRIGEKARKVGQEHGLYASVMIAQAILETGSGGSQLSQEPYYNLFGIKGDHEGQSVTFATYEDDGSGNWYQIQSAFRQYPSYTESFEDYAELLKDGTEWNPTIYEGTWKEKAASYREATKALTGVYATDTLYDEKLNAFIEEYELTEYDKAEPSSSSGGLIIADSHPDSDFKDYAGESYPGAEYYAAGNCTQYAYNRVVQLGGYVEVNMGNGMDWGATGKARGYEVSHEPKAGTALCFQPGVAGADSTYGHVAFVEHVYEDGSILISEMNAAGLGVVSFRMIDKQTAEILTYITPK